MGRKKTNKSPESTRFEEVLIEYFGSVKSAMDHWSLGDNSVSPYLSGFRNLGAQWKVRLEEIGYSFIWVTSGKGAKYLPKQLLEPTTPYQVREYPVAGKIQAGKGAVTFEYNTVEPGPPGVTVNNGYWFVVKGDSMEPRYFAGEMVFVQKDIHPQNGDFAVVVWDNFNEGSAKQIYYKENVVALKSLNPKYELILIDKKEIVFIGKITHSKHK